jgi:hypothetical protein
MTIRRICWATGMTAVLMGGFGLARSWAQDDSLDALKVAPGMTKLLIDNAFVRVTEETVPPGKGVPKHSHKRGVTVALTDYDSEQTLFPSGQVVRTHRHQGEVSWAEPVVHEAHNVGTTVQNVVRIELK